MNLLVTGRGTSGSWRIRGEQLGYAMGATVLPGALDVAAYDLAVVVKRAPLDLLQRLHRAGVPIVWDIVDAWPQPHGNAWGRSECMNWLAGMVSTIRPRALVAATQAMARDCEAFGLPVLALPHHARPGLRRTPIRPLQVVGYEGSPAHLGTWRPWLVDECERRGLRFVLNPESLNDLDVVVAVRELTGYAPTHWKSNVKLANAQASGTPIICARESGYLETATGAEIFVEDGAGVLTALEDLKAPETRAQLAERLAAAPVALDTIAATYVRWLRSVAP